MGMSKPVVNTYSQHRTRGGRHNLDRRRGVIKVINVSLSPWLPPRRRRRIELSIAAPLRTPFPLAHITCVQRGDVGSNVLFSHRTWCSRHDTRAAGDNMWLHWGAADLRLVRRSRRAQPKDRMPIMLKVEQASANGIPADCRCRVRCRQPHSPPLFPWIFVFLQAFRRGVLPIVRARRTAVGTIFDDQHRQAQV